MSLYFQHPTWCQAQEWAVNLENMLNQIHKFFPSNGASLVAQMAKNLPAMQETQVQYLSREDPLEKEMAAHSNILAWRIPWTEEPGGQQSIGSQRVLLFFLMDLLPKCKNHIK